MSKDKTLQMILESIGALRKNFGSMSGDVGSLQETVSFLKDNMASKSDLERFATKDDLERFATKEDLLRFATKEDLQQYATKDDLFEFRNDIMDHIDGFIGLHKALDLEHNALRSKVNRMEKEFLDFRGQQLAA